MNIRICCLLVGYLCGLLQTSYLYGKAHGIDIREYGSGNAGTTNALRTLGKKAGLITLLGDALKCVLAVVIVHFLFGTKNPQIAPLLRMYAAAGTILGHNFPFYLHFKGGKGIAATAGLILTFGWKMTLLAAVVFFSIVLVTHYVSLASIVLYLVFVASIVWMGNRGVFGMDPAHTAEMYGVAVFLAALAIYKHRGNIARLLEGTENKTYLIKKKG